MSEMFLMTDVLQRALDYHAKRHNLLASNVANADTPGFRPAELLRVPDSHVTTNVPVARTDEGHQLSTQGAEDPRFLVLEDQSAPVSADGNAVSVEREMSKISANGVRYDSAARLVKANLGMLRYVSSDAQGR